MNKEPFAAAHPFLICIDSDGCVFDTMEIKHKECFCPATVEHFHLQPVSRYARDAWDFVNLYSCFRGIHRLLALLKALDLLACRREVQERGFVPPALPALRRYVQEGRPLSNDGLQAYLEEHPQAEDIRTTLEWSVDVNERIGRMVHGIPPFPHVRESLQAARRHADIVIVSATQQLALSREWGEHGLLELVSGVMGQESGSKKQIIAALKGRYGPGRVLMIGDAPGDRDAAHENGALFYPIRPDHEAHSWAEFEDALQAFLEQRYAGEPEQSRIRAFEKLLPCSPAWESACQEREDERRDPS